ncbi:F-box and WD repeat domain containing protein 10B-like [Tubulanus polymorphus]|uniref:F-box and WD repeat domain containing protein 10B-like n=1 Tax=Tubulanus polymorphus TaxID=672921 RepID=UPI003DA42470
MKHPENNCEPFEFNIGRAFDLRCVENADGPTVCGACEACQIIAHLDNAIAWFERFGSQAKQRFLHGLVRRFRSVDLLEYVVSLLQPLLCKDYTYTRTRTKPSQQVDQPTMTGDHALDIADLEDELVEIFHWFMKANYWTKTNFVLGILKICDMPLLFSVGTLARTLLSSERNAHSSIPIDEYTEAASIPSSRFTYESEDHPEHELLRLASPQYGLINNVSNRCPSVSASGYPVSEYGDVERIIINDENEDTLTIDLDDFIHDPTNMVLPSSAKAFAGVSKHKDFIRCLPVHLSKYILSYLDQGSLFNGLCVSRYWRMIVEEVHREHFVNQQLWEDVMLMQGAAAAGVNPLYAQDTDVPVPNLVPGTLEVIKTTDNIIETTFKSEANFQTGYSGICTRNVIMEERNVYCGAYNIMVVNNVEDPNRVFHTDGGSLIAIGSNDRKVRFLDNVTGRTVGPTVHGHAGSIKCLHMCESKGFVLSGSYDTSIRCWDIKTGQCLKILRGHQGTVSCLAMYKDLVVSGSKDSTCKVWDLSSGKCQRTFRHKAAISAAAIGGSMCVTGCEAGKVKVWNLKNGNLIKVLLGHHGPVTCIKFDRWHIVTGSKDNYVLVWSAQGEHARCLNALRHQKEVLCLEFMYLRVVSGSADGRLRIWNIITGQCCRIMRGNSRSDPILGLVAIGNRITLNTHINLLTLNFEEVEWDYTLETDKMPPLVTYGSYSDAPVRQRPYGYIRAQRMKQAGATNTKITRHAKNDAVFTGPAMTPRAEQLPHSAKSLSAKSMMRSKLIQQRRAESAKEPLMKTKSQQRIVDERLDLRDDENRPPSTATSRPPSSKRPPSSRVATAKSRTQSVSIAPAPSEIHDDDDTPIVPNRRISWAFEKPNIPKCKNVTLSETKAILRSQMRAKEVIPPPDFIYLSVAAIHNSQSREPAAKNTESNQNYSINDATKLHSRPPSAPSRLDTRARLPRNEINVADFWSQASDDEEAITELDSVATRPKSANNEPNASKTPIPAMETFTTDFEVVDSSPRYKSIHPMRVKSSIPRGKIIRPHTVNVAQGSRQPSDVTKQRPHTAVGLARRPTSGSSSLNQRPMSSKSAVSSASVRAKRRIRPESTAPSPPDADMVPMLMYPPNMIEKIKNKVKSMHVSQLSISRSSSEPALLGVNQYNDPMRSHAQFKLRTYEQEKQYLHDIANLYRQQKKQKVIQGEQDKRKAWLMKAKGQTPTARVVPAVN